MLEFDKLRRFSNTISDFNMHNSANFVPSRKTSIKRDESSDILDTTIIDFDFDLFAKEKGNDKGNEKETNINKRLDFSISEMNDKREKEKIGNSKDNEN